MGPAITGDALCDLCPPAKLAALSSKESRKVCAQGESVFGRVLVEQSLKLRVVPQWIPARIELEDGHSDAVRRGKEVIEQLKCLRMVADPGVNLRKSDRDQRSTERVFRFRQQFDSTLALRDGLLLF